MKARGTRGGILLSLEPGDDVGSVAAVLDAHSELLQDKVFVEISERTTYALVTAIAGRVSAAGGELVDVRPPISVMQARGETVIVARTVRSGGKVDSTGSVVVLGDVNAGAEILANDDIIVVGTLRGLAHAGASGNEKAVIWAERIMSPQLRIGNALAQAGSNSGESEDGPEVAHLKDGAIVIRPWNTN
ncbi:MAG TPA: septum site-determining protein MinC [Trueperaceae bacterium]|nr:septum site-determining protein MinC [Trueperaceae bacterium]HRP47612.1 septum site-determining protein MinC [Trueperaceae bacterium]